MWCLRQIIWSATFVGGHSATVLGVAASVFGLAEVFGDKAVFVVGVSAHCHISLLIILLVVATIITSHHIPAIFLLCGHQNIER